MENYDYIFKEISENIINLINSASTLDDLNDIKNKYLSKKGEFSKLRSWR